MSRVAESSHALVPHFARTDNSICKPIQLSITENASAAGKCLFVIQQILPNVNVPKFNCHLKKHNTLQNNIPIVFVIVVYYI